jgi:hypothetical protein
MSINVSAVGCFDQRSLAPLRDGCLRLAIAIVALLYVEQRHDNATFAHQQSILPVEAASRLLGVMLPLGLFCDNASDDSPNDRRRLVNLAFTRRPNALASSNRHLRVGPYGAAPGSYDCDRRLSPRTADLVLSDAGLR